MFLNVGRSSSALNVPSLEAHPSVWRFDDDDFQGSKLFFIIILIPFALASETQWAVSAVWCWKFYKRTHFLRVCDHLLRRVGLLHIKNITAHGRETESRGSKQTRFSMRPSVCQADCSSSETHTRVFICDFLIFYLHSQYRVKPPCWAGEWEEKKFKIAYFDTY